MEEALALSRRVSMEIDSPSAVSAFCHLPVNVKSVTGCKYRAKVFEKIGPELLSDIR